MWIKGQPVIGSGGDNDSKMGVAETRTEVEILAEQGPRDDICPAPELDNRIKLPLYLGQTF